MANALLFKHWVVDEDFEETETTFHFRAHRPVDPECCLKCGSIRKPWLKETTIVKYRHAPMFGKRVVIHAAAKRYKCLDCGKSFMQEMPEMHPKRDMTLRCLSYIEEHGLKRTFREVAREVGFASDKTVRDICRPVIDAMTEGHRPYAPVILGIDELTLAGKKRTVFTDVGERRILDILPSMDQQAVARWLSALPHRNRVLAVTIDMWGSYRDVVRAYIPHAFIIVDKWHVQKRVNDCLDRLRNDTRHANNAARRAAKIAKKRPPPKIPNSWKDRRVLHMGREKLAKRPDRKFLLEARLANDPLLSDAWHTKEAFYSIWEARNRKEAECLFDHWRANIPPSVEHVYGELADTVMRWREEIFIFFEHRYTNAYTEACNGLIKIVNRRGRGYKTFEVIRARAISLTKQKTNDHFVCEDCLGRFPIAKGRVHYYLVGDLPDVMVCAENCPAEGTWTFLRALVYAKGTPPKSAFTCEAQGVASPSKSA